MALYWPEQGVALEIVDDPLAEPFDRAAHPGVRVIQTTCDELADLDRCNRVMTRVARELAPRLRRPRPGSSPGGAPCTRGSWPDAALLVRFLLDVTIK